MFKKLKSALLRGVVVLLPVLFLIIILKEFADLLIGLATPIAALFPVDLIDSIPETEVLAALLLIGAALAVGLLAMVPPIRALGRQFDSRVLERIPVYLPLKKLLQALLGADGAESFKPGVLVADNGTLEPVYIVDDIGKPRIIVLVPWTPTSFAGSLKFVPREKVYQLDMTFEEFSLATGHFGVGLLDKMAVTPEHIKWEGTAAPANERANMSLLTRSRNDEIRK